MPKIITMFRGGTPDFKGWFRRGDYPEFTPPFGMPPMPSTPPFNSHADAAYNQGYLNLQFPLVPRIEETTAHGWMWNALKQLGEVGDRIYTNWIPLRSIVTDFYWELTRTDKELDGVYLKPVAARVTWDFDARDWVYNDNTAYASMLTSNNVSQFPLGTPSDGDSVYGYANNINPRCTFGHDLLKKDGKGKLTEEGLDELYGAVVLGYEVSEGSPEKIANIWKSNFALYFTCKLLSFECGIQV